MSRIYEPYFIGFKMHHYFMYHCGGGGTKSNYVIKFKVHSDFKNVKVKKKF